MASPEIKLEWGGGKWPSSLRTAVRPTVKTALGIATEGLDYLDIPLQEDKRAVVWRTTNTFPCDGSTLNADLFELYLRVGMLKHNKLRRYVAELANTAFHESVHCVRYEYSQRNDLLELAATEGLAYCAGDLFSRALMKPHEYDDMQAIVGTLSPKALEVTSELFAADVEADFVRIAAGELNDDIEDQWFDEELPMFYGIPGGVVLGVARVGAHLEAGKKLADLITLPAEELMAA